MDFSLFCLGFLGIVVVVVVFMMSVLLMAFLIDWLPLNAGRLGIVTRYLARFFSWMGNTGEFKRPFFAAAVISCTVLAVIVWWNWPIGWMREWSGWAGFAVPWLVGMVWFFIDYVGLVFGKNNRDER